MISKAELPETNFIVLGAARKELLALPERLQALTFAQLGRLSRGEPADTKQIADVFELRVKQVRVFFVWNGEGYAVLSERSG